MEGLFPLSRMVAGRGGFGEEGNVLPSTSSMITEMEMLPRNAAYPMGIYGDDLDGGRRSDQGILLVCAEFFSEDGGYLA
jgi:hypothetical protein